jgi:hypothetical protein
MKQQDSCVERRSFRPFCTAALLVALGVVVFLYLGISTAWHAEKTLHAVNLVTVVVDHDLQDTNRWPKSWRDLHAVNQINAPSKYEWPADAETVKKLVTIDFEAEVKVIASQTADDFDAIRPIGSTYPYQDYGFIDSLIESAKTVADSR